MPRTKRRLPACRPRIVTLEINGVTQHFATWSPAPLMQQRLCDLRPYPALDAAMFIQRIMRPKKEARDAE